MALNIGGFINLPMLEPREFGQEVEKYRNAGIGLVGLNMEYPNGPATSAKWLPALKRALKSADMKVVVHAPYSDFNLMTLSPYLREVSIKEIKAAIDIAKELGAGIVTIHAGKINRFAERNDLAKKALKEPLNDLIDYASLAGIRLSAENLESKAGTSRNYPSTIEESEEILSSFKGLEFCIDTGHFHSGGVDVYKAIRQLVTRSNCIHIHDVMGNKDHMVIGKGQIDFKQVISMLVFADFRGAAIIENGTTDECIESYNALKPLLST